MLPPELIDKTIALLSQNDQVFLSWEYSIPLSAVSGYMTNQLYRIIEYNERHRILYLKPDGTAPKDAYLHTFNTFGQMFESMQVARIEISGPRTRYIMLATGYTQPISVKYKEPSYSPPPRAQQQPAPPTRDYRFTEILSFDIRDAIFDEGMITIKLKVKSKGVNVDVRIDNPAIKKYFDSVKNYIANILGGNKTPITVTFDMQNGKWIPLSVDDCVLKTLDESIMERVQEDFVEQVVLSGERDDIISLDDLIEPVKNDAITVDTIFDHVVQEEKTKHYHHLRYLSARQAIDLQKLSITGNPLSFVFVVRESGGMYLIWETYNTPEATYIWKIDGTANIIQKFGLILELRKSNKMLYLQKKEPAFYRIVHQYNLERNGFVKWKEKIEQIFANNDLSK